MARKNIPQIDALVQRTFAQKMWDNGFHPYKDHTEWLRHHPRGRMGRLYAVFPAVLLSYGRQRPAFHSRSDPSPVRTKALSLERAARGKEETICRSS